MEIDLRFVCEKVTIGEVLTMLQFLDIFTKGLPAPLYGVFRVMIQSLSLVALFRL